MEEEDRCREHGPRGYCWGVSGLDAVLGFCLFAGFPRASEESTMRAELQLQLMGPAFTEPGEQGREGGRGGGRKGGCWWDRLQLPRTRRSPK